MQESHAYTFSISDLTHFVINYLLFNR